MRIAFPYNGWRGGFFNSIIRSFIEMGYDTYTCRKFNKNKMYNILLKFKIIPEINNTVNQNKYILNQITEYKPDLFFNIGGGSILPSTVDYIKNNLKCKLVCWIADNPCDPAPYRDKYFAMTLKYYDKVLLPEPLWKNIMSMIAPQTEVIPFYGGYEPSNFFPINISNLSKLDVEKYSSEISFTGDSYGFSPEGVYRAGILCQLDKYSLKLWGDQGWKLRFSYYPNLKQVYMGDRLSYENLRKVYSLSKINLNIPSPQIWSGFQPRVFEIAATNSFQIIRYSEELYRIFDKDALVMFNSIKDLKDKIDYYLKNEKERIEIAQNMYNKVTSQYTWKSQVNNIIEKIV